METYVVRIYRRDAKENVIAGFVEAVESQKKTQFASSEELHAILIDLEKRGTKVVWEGE